jgi:hypothetical protein
MSSLKYSYHSNQWLYVSKVTGTYKGSWVLDASACLLPQGLVSQSASITRSGSKVLHVTCEYCVYVQHGLGIQLQIYNCCIKTWKENVAGHRWCIKCSVTSSVKQMPFACVFLFLFVPPTFAHMPVTLTEPPQTFWLKLLVEKLNT